jgi:chemotaxis protein MotA
MLGRRNGMVALEEHVSNPDSSSIFSKYPKLAGNHHAIEFLCSGLRPVIDGKVKPDQLKTLMEIELQAMETEHHNPIDVLTKAADAMPGFGIVAAVLGIVITMGSIAGPVEEIGHHVAAALVGTFLGILVSYGFLNPLCVNMTFNGQSEITFIKSISSAVVGFANGMAPVMAVEVARRGLDSEIKPSPEELEAMLKGIGK